MGKARSRRFLVYVTSFLLVTAWTLSASPDAWAQNKKRSWEIFIYFGQYAGQEVPSAIQQAVVETYRIDLFRAQFADPNSTAPNDPRVCPICRNVGDTGDPNGTLSQSFLGPPGQPGVAASAINICADSNGAPLPISRDSSSPFFDECDGDVEAKYEYNPNGIVTNGQVQVDDSAFLLGARLGYNITNHIEVEVDLGFAKQRLDMTQNLIPMLTEPVSNPADPFFNQLASFYQFTWANRDFIDLGYRHTLDATNPSLVVAVDGIREIPNVPQRRKSNNAGATIPAVLPMPYLPAETFPDVTAFINRVFLDPAAIRNRANQINIDIFSAGISGIYNFNTKPDSRIIPYVTAGAGRWMRQFDRPYKGEDTSYYTYGGGIRFFVNEIFSFRMEGRQVSWTEDTTHMSATIPRQDLTDFSNSGTTACFRDQDPPAQQPPQECSMNAINEYNMGLRPRLPAGANPGGFAQIDFETTLDDFWEARIGFDVLLGGR